MSHGPTVKRCNWVLVWAVASAAAAACAQGADDALQSGGAGAAGGTAGADGGSVSLGGSSGDAGLASCESDFEAGAIGEAVTATRIAVFDEPAGAAPPFVFDPPSGVLVPEGWPSPEFLVHTDELPEVVMLELTVVDRTSRVFLKPAIAPRAHADSEVSGAWWTVRAPDAIWQGAKCVGPAGTELAISWRIAYVETGSATPGGESSGSVRLLRNAKVPDLSYWQILDQQGPSGSFSIERLAVGAKPQTLLDRGGDCFGCHATSPDGKDFALQSSAGGWRVEIVRPDAKVPTGLPSPVVSPSAAELLQTTSLMVPTMARDLWSDASGRFVAAVTGPAHSTPGRIAMLQLDASSAALAVAPGLPGSKSSEPAAGETGDPIPSAELLAATPALSPDGKRIAFVASSAMVDGYHAPTGFLSGSSDLWLLPVTAHKDQLPVFGSASPLPGASETAENESFPHWSADGKLIAYMRSAPEHGGYDEETATIWIVPADGSSPPVSIAGNAAPGSADPKQPVFHGLGLTNSWPRFSESVIDTASGAYHFLVFSSRRGPADLWEARLSGSQSLNGRPIAHLYLSAVLVKKDGSIETYPAAFVPGQRIDAGAHTASFTTVTSVPPPPPEVR